MGESLSQEMLDFLEGVVHQESFERNGYEYNVKTFTSHERVEKYIEKNPSFSIMQEENGYIYVGTKTEIEKPSNINESYTGAQIYEAAVSNGLTEEAARKLVVSLGE